MASPALRAASCESSPVQSTRVTMPGLFRLTVWLSTSTALTSTTGGRTGSATGGASEAVPVFSTSGLATGCATGACMVDSWAAAIDAKTAPASIIPNAAYDLLSGFFIDLLQ